MNTYLPFLIIGLTTGSLYGLAAMGLVVTYKTSGILNFGHGAIAAASAAAFYSLRQQAGLPWPIAALVVLAVISPLIGLAMDRMARALVRAPLVFAIVATVGVVLVVQSGVGVIFGTTPTPFKPYLPTDAFKVGGVYVGVDQALTFVAATLTAIALSIYFRVSRTGVAMRAAVDDAALLGLAGERSGRVRASAWIIGVQLAALAGMLIVPTIGLDAGLLTLLVVQAFGAAAVGRFSNLGVTYLGGLAVGVAAAMVKRISADVHPLSGLSTSVPFIVLVLILMGTPTRKLVARVQLPGLVAPAPRQRTGPSRVAMNVTGAAALFLVPLVVGVKTPLYTNGLIFALIFLSLGLLVWTSGQISLCHMSFVAVGASSAGILTSEAHLPWLPAVILAGFCAVPVGIIVALPAIRLAGVFVALATFGFAILMQDFVYPSRFMFGKTGTRYVPRPHLPGIDLTTNQGYYWTVLAFLLPAGAVVALVIRSRLGRLLRALADNPAALLTHGANINAVRIFVFCLSAFLAGVAGALSGGLTGSVTGLGFDYFTSLTLVAVLALSGRTVGLPPSLVAAFGLTVVPSLVSGLDPQVLNLGFGVSAIVVALCAGSARPFPGLLHELAQRTHERLDSAPRRPVRPTGSGTVEAAAAMGALT